MNKFILAIIAVCFMATVAWAVSTGDKWKFEGPVTVENSLAINKVTADPCGVYAAGSIFYNDVGGFPCFCDGTDDLKFNNYSVACF